MPAGADQQEQQEQQQQQQPAPTQQSAGPQEGQENSRPRAAVQHEQQHTNPQRAMELPAAQPSPTREPCQHSIHSIQQQARAAPAGDQSGDAAAAAAGRPAAAKRGRPAKDKQTPARKKLCTEKQLQLSMQEDITSAAPVTGEQEQQEQVQEHLRQAAQMLPAAGSPWPQLLLQQQQLLNFAACSSPEEPAGKPHKQLRRPPKTTGQHQLRSEGCCFSLERPFGSLSAATGHHSLMPPGFQHQQPAHWLLQQAQLQAQQQQQQQGTGNAADVLRGCQAQPTEPSAGSSDAGLKTRLSMRSVAYLEELLQQTAQAASHSNSAAGSQPAAQARPQAHKSMAVTSRLSVGNLLISPPMSRAASTCVSHLPTIADVDTACQAQGTVPAGSAAAVAAWAAAEAQAAAAAAAARAAELSTRPASITATADVGTASGAAEAPSKQTALLPLNLAFPKAPSRAASPAGSDADTAVAARAASRARHERSTAVAGNRLSSRQLLAGGMAVQEQQKQLASASMAVLPPSAAAAPAARRSRIGIPQLQAAVAAAAAAAVAGITAAAAPSSNPGSPPVRQRKLPTTADINRAAAAAVAAFQMSAAAAAAAARDDGSSSDTSSSGDDDREAMDAAVWTAYRSGAGGTPDGAGAAGDRGKGGAKLQADASCSSDTTSPPSSPDAPGSQAVLGAFAAGRRSSHAGGQGLLNPAAQLSCLQPGLGQKLPMHARKSDRQVGLETVSRIDAIFQQLRSLQASTAPGSNPVSSALSPPAVAPPSLDSTAAAQVAAAAAGLAGHLPAVEQTAAAATTATAAAEPTAAAAAAGAVAEAGPAAAGAAGGQDVVGCSLAALCRGLRYEGDITLKEVAMAFQLRDAYDWDEDLEAAAAKQVGL